MAVVGDFAEGPWVVAETIALAIRPWRLDIDQDRATMLMLVCPADRTAAVGAAPGDDCCSHPDQLEGY